MEATDSLRALATHEVTCVVILGGDQNVRSQFRQHFRCPLFLVSRGETRFLPLACGGAEVWAPALSSELFSQLIEPGMLTHAILISAGAPWIVPPDVLKLFPSRAFNLHPGSLPSNRGASAVSWSIMNREEEPRFTLHSLTSEIDGGEVIIEQSLGASSQVATVEEARHRYDIALADVLESFFRLIDSSSLGDQVPVPDRERAYFPALSAEKNGWINWDWNGADIESFIRAFSRPYPGASTLHEQHQVRVLDAEFRPSEVRRHPFANGIVVDRRDGGIVVCVTGGQLIICAGDIYGVDTNSILIGDRLFTPATLLDEAKQHRRRNLSRAHRHP